MGSETARGNAVFRRERDPSCHYGWIEKQYGLVTFLLRTTVVVPAEERSAAEPPADPVEQAAYE
ncbi:Hypothetical protein A7982_04706 [Minicystis rosea]|nr:Hypothetical protein A7982_04706 [Minicystis rosea]